MGTWDGEIVVIAGAGLEEGEGGVRRHWLRAYINSDRFSVAQ
jgi:hypothetical protein